MQLFNRLSLITALLLLGGCGGGGGGGDTPVAGTTPVSPFNALVFADPLLGDCVKSEAIKNGWTSLADAKSLDCGQAGVRLIGGLQALDSLESLNLNGNPLKDIAGLADLSKLRTLNLSSMPNIEDINVLLTLGLLTTVNLSESASGELTCASVDALTNMGVSVTPPDSCKVLIVDVVFADPALKACVLSAASQDQLVFTNEVVTLACPQMGIIQLDDLTNFANLHSIDFSGNQVSDLTPLIGLAQLEAVDASANPISNLAPLGQAPVLRTLRLNGISNRANLDLGILVNLAPLKTLFIDGLGQGGLPGQQGGQFNCEALDALAARLDAFNGPLGCRMLIADVAFGSPAIKTCLEAFGGGPFRSHTDAFSEVECHEMGITSLEGLERFGPTEILDLRNTSGVGPPNDIQDLAPLSSMYSLRILSIDGSSTITSLDALRSVPNLLEVSAPNVPNLSDISALVHMTTLDTVDLSNSGVTGLISCDDVNLLQTKVLRFTPPASCDNGLPPPKEPARLRTDLNADGSADLFLEYAASSFDQSAEPAAKFWGSRINSNGPPGQFLSAGSLVPFDTINFERAKAIAVADANGDGKDDVLVQLDAVDGSVHWQILLSDGQSVGVPAFSANSLPGGNDARAVGFKDINGDGRADILIQQQVNGLVSYHLSLALGSGNGYANLTQVFRFDPSLGRPEIVALEDVNNDGTADFVFDRRLGNRHCYFVRTFQKGTNSFEQQSSSNACYALDYPADWPIQAVGVADLDGDRRSELVFSLAVGQARTEWDYFTLESGPSGSQWGSPRFLATETTEGSQRTIAVADLNNDGRADLLNEVTVGSARTWVAYLAAAPGTFQRQTWLTGFANYETLGLRDFNNDGRLDLLIDVPENVAGTLTQKLYVKLNDGQTFDGPSSPWNIWHEDSKRPKVLGMEEDGITSNARDMGTLTAWSGVSDGRLYTPNEFKQSFTQKGLTLRTPTKFTDLDDLPLKEGECKAVYAQGGTERRARGQFGVMACNIKLADGASLKLQPLYGGCESINIDSVSSGAGGNCAIGSIKTDIEIEVGGVKQTTSIAGPSAAVCAGVSLKEFACVKAGATLVSGSQKYIVNGTGAGAGASIGVGLKADFKAADGVISGEIGAALGLGVDIQFSLNYKATGNFIIKNGKTAFVFVGDNAEKGVVAAGDAVYGAAKDLGKVTQTAVGDAVYLAGQGADAVAAIIPKDSLIGKTVDQVAAGVDAAISAAGGAANYVGGAIIDIGSGVASGVGAIGSFIGDFF